MNKIKLLPSLLVFAEVAEKGSFTLAADDLGLSKSAVSQQISRLERQLGLQLLVRNTRGLSVTAIGQTLLLRCQLLKDQVDRAYGELSDAEQMPSGEFSVTFPHALERGVAAPAIAQLCREYPRLQPRLLVADEKKDLVRDKLDAAIFIGQLEDSSYRALPVGTMKEIFCATPTFLQRHGMPKSVDDMRRLPWIATSWQKKTISAYAESLGATPEATPTPPFAKVNTLPGALELALQHSGMILLADIIGQPLIQSGELVRIFTEYRGPVWPVYLVHPFQNEKPAHVTRFHQLIRFFFARVQV